MNYCDFNICILYIYIFVVNQLRLSIGEIKLLLTYLSITKVDTIMFVYDIIRFWILYFVHIILFGGVDSGFLDHSFRFSSKILYKKLEI